MNDTVASPQAMTQMPARKPRLMEKFAERFHVDPEKMLVTLKNTAFKQQPSKPEVTNEQMMALVVVADQYGLNPFTKEIYAFPDKNNGIVPVVGIDGWSRIINSHSEFDGMEFKQSANIITELQGAKACPEWIECVIYRKDRQHPIAIKEFLDEVYRPPMNGYNGPWQSHTKRMLRHKAMIQCARIAFGFVGIFDQDEAERIIEGEVIASETDGKQKAQDLNAEIMGGKTNNQTIDESPSSDSQAPVTPHELIDQINRCQSSDELTLLEDLAREVDGRTAEGKALKEAIAAAHAKLSAE